jgi:hypothetical protein
MDGDPVDSYGFAQIRRFQSEHLSDYLRNLLEAGGDEGRKNFGSNNFQVVKGGSVCDGHLLRAGKWMERGRSIPSPLVIDTLLVCGVHALLRGNAIYDVITVPMRIDTNWNQLNSKVRFQPLVKASFLMQQKTDRRCDLRAAKLFSKCFAANHIQRNFQAGGPKRSFQGLESLRTGNPQ